jgi:dipeptidyl aminopeptidase/acylaminoacyl peptidase
MHVSVNGVRLFFDVEGAALLPDGPVMREKPIMLLLHGGPGGDHSGYKPSFSQLADLVQIVYLVFTPLPHIRGLRNSRISATEYIK